jgi:uncharacterized membrane protein
MAILLYFTEGVVRATSDTGPSVPLAVAETLLATTAFAAILAYVRTRRQPATS